MAVAQAWGVAVKSVSIAQVGAGVVDVAQGGEVVVKQARGVATEVVVF